MTPRPAVFSSLILMLAAGCSALFQPKEELTPPPLNALTENQAYVYVEGRYRGLTPGTFVVNRRFEEAIVTLRLGKRVLRTFEIERVNSSNRSSLDFSFSGSTSGGVRTYNVEELPVVRDTVHVIPYYAGRLEVNDNRFGLTLVVSN